MRVAPPQQLLSGLGTGMVFGALLQKGQVAKYDVIMRQLLLEDSRVLKVMGSAIAFGAAGVYALVSRGRAKLEVKSLNLGGVVGGAALFGAGLSLLGYCPGTTLAALGEGRRDAIGGVLGMLAGAGLFVRAYPTMKPLLEAGDLGKTTLPAATRTSPWGWIAGIAATLALGALASRGR